MTVIGFSSLLFQYIKNKKDYLNSDLPDAAWRSEAGSRGFWIKGTNHEVDHVIQPIQLYPVPWERS